MANLTTLKEQRKQLMKVIDKYNICILSDGITFDKMKSYSELLRLKDAKSVIGAIPATYSDELMYCTTYIIVEHDLINNTIIFKHKFLRIKTAEEIFIETKYSIPCEIIANDNIQFKFEIECIGDDDINNQIHKNESFKHWITENMAGSLFIFITNYRIITENNRKYQTIFVI